MLTEFLPCLLPVVEAPHCESDFSLLAENEQPFGSCSAAIETKKNLLRGTQNVSQLCSLNQLLLHEKLSFPCFLLVKPKSVIG